MHRIEAPGATEDNLFTEGDAPTGVPATEVSDDWLNAVQEEIISVLTAAGITPQTAGTDTRNQLAAAIAALIGSFGLGDATVLDATDNLDNVHDSGFYTYSSSSAPVNAPDAAAAKLIVVGGPNISAGTLQIWSRRNSSQLQYRQMNSAGVWTPWRVVIDSNNIASYVGSVVMPVGATYVQYPGKATPASLYGGTWTLQFNTEGIFFRTEGGNASAFGAGIQNDELKSHTHLHTDTVSKNSSPGGEQMRQSDGQTYALQTTKETQATGGVETRPRNRTIRVWERTAL